MADIASLGIRVTQQGAKEAASDLEKLASSGARAEKQAQKIAPSMAAAAKSSRELQFATRNLPAQFTDIATALGSGQRPLQVLLQQGGQIKDMFGGIGPAARAMGGYVAGLINPFTLAAAAVGGLVIAFAKAESQTESFNRALILTGNNADLTAAQLRDMADDLDRTTSATAGKASDVLAQVASTGRFTAEQIQLVATAAINMQQASGQAIEDTIKEFVRLQDDPVNAILKLNDSQHFLTEETIKQIEQLRKQGDEAGAAAVAIRAYADTINQRTPEINKHLSTGAALWRDIKSAISEAGDAVVQWAGDADRALQDFLRQHEAGVRRLANVYKFLPVFGSQVVGFQLDSAVDNAKRAGQQQGGTRTGGSFNFAEASGGRIVTSAEVRDRIKFEEDAAKFKDQFLSREQQKKRALAELDKFRAQYTEAEYQSLKKQVELRFAEPKGRKPRDNSRAIANASDRFDDMVGGLRAQLQGPLQKAEEDHLKRMRELQQAAKDGKRSHDDLAAALGLEGEAYRKATADIQERFDAEIASLSGPVAQAQQAHEAAVRRIDELTQQANLSSDERIALLNAEAEAYRQDMLAAQRAADPIGALLADMRFELDLIGKSNAERTVMNELRRQGIDLMSAEAQGALGTARAFEQEAEAKQRSIDLMDDFRSGAAEAFTDFVTGAKSAKDAIGSFFDYLFERATRAVADQWIAKLFGQQGSDGAGTSGGGWLAALFGGGSGSQGSLADLFSGGWGFAKGAAFAGGNVVPFASGGLVTSPTRFGMSGGRLGLMGEAGPEAIVPLHRGPDGKLGIRMERSPSAMPQRLSAPVIHQVIQVQGLMGNRTPGQVARASAEAQSKALRNR